MQLGMIGLGRMGANMAQRLLRAGHECVAYDVHPEAVQALVGQGAEVVRRLDPIFRALAPGIGAAPRTPGRESESSTAEYGYLHCGPNGGGHFVKMVHNGIEYGLMAAYAEGLNVLRHANVGTQQREVDAETTPLRDPEAYQYDLNLG